MQPLVIGILVFECDKCHDKWVIDSESINLGYTYVCECGRNWGCPPYSTLEIEIKRCDLPGIDDCDTATYKTACKALHKEYNKQLKASGCEAISLSAYKSLVAEWIMGNKKAKVPTKSKKVVSLSGSGVDIEAVVTSLQMLGFSRSDALEKVNISLKDGYLNNDDLIKAVLSL